jgi:ribosomal protein S8
MNIVGEVISKILNMTFSDPVVNMLTAIRNANMRAFRDVVFPYSSFKWNICEKLEKSNFLSNC